MVKPDRPFIIPIFISNAGCPFRCIFCNQKAITLLNDITLSPESIVQQINTFLNFKKKDNTNEIQLAFYGGNFLGLDDDLILSLLNCANKLVIEGKINTIRFSTRPDTINLKKLDIIKKFPVSTIELGIQSLNDEILNLIKRGYSSKDCIKAVLLLKDYKFKIGFHIMAGLPGDNGLQSIESAKIMASLFPDFVRIHPTIVFAQTVLEKLFNDGEYIPLSLEEAVEIVKQIYLIFLNNKIPVIRMGLQIDYDYKRRTSVLAGPYHPSFGHLVYSKIFLEKAIDIIQSKNDVQKILTIKVNNKNVSNIKGLNNSNINILKKKFNIELINIIPDSSIPEDKIELEH